MGFSESTAQQIRYWIFQDLTSNTYNSGGVSVYAYDADAKQFMFKYDLKSPKASESNMFGFKVASLGDADADGQLIRFVLKFIIILALLIYCCGCGL